ncbi:hypothetical protein [Bacillus sp. 7894-2]|uniref:hypothetical protein n=1 Tax=Bacillus sp. 7894-2 TaxID=2021695 RepID=UPI000BA6EBF4|nr:hypothetical protein [Bacillus sp. 7894-2]PAE24061.1 hypothetical protein CHI10_14760 [Bacillus sp. 7894-2]
MEKRKPIAYIGLTNVASVQIYDLNGGDAVLAGINDHEPEWCEVYYAIDENNNDEFFEDSDEPVHEPRFKLGELELSLSEAMRVNF